jgi:AcrR family transcriptional regulator
MRNTVVEAAQTRRRILDAALRCFATDGWSGTSFVRVAEHAGVTRGAVHHHFTDKASLLGAALTQGWSEHAPTPEPAAGDVAGQPGQTDPVERLIDFLADYLDRLRDVPEFRTLATVSTLVAPQISEPLPGLPEKRGALSAWTDQIGVLLTDIAATTSLSVSADSAAFLIASVTFGMTVSAALTEADLPPREESRSLARQLVLALVGPPEPTSKETP